MSFMFVLVELPPYFNIVFSPVQCMNMNLSRLSDLDWYGINALDNSLAPRHNHIRLELLKSTTLKIIQIGVQCL